MVLHAQRLAHLAYAIYIYIYILNILNEMNYSREHHDPFTANSWEDIFEFRGSKVAQQISN